MKPDFFNQPPQGYVRSPNGWLRAAKTPQMTAAKRLRVENKDLKSRLEQLEAAVAEIVSKKGKK